MSFIQSPSLSVNTGNFRSVYLSGSKGIAGSTSNLGLYLMTCLNSLQKEKPPGTPDKSDLEHEGKTIFYSTLKRFFTIFYNTSCYQCDLVIILYINYWANSC